MIASDKFKTTEVDAWVIAELGIAVPPKVKPESVVNWSFARVIFIDLALTPLETLKEVENVWE
jgi:hypothetical protein